MPLTTQDFNNAQVDLQTVSAVSNSKNQVGSPIDSTTTRLGDTSDTLNGRLKKLGYMPPITYAGGISFAALDNVKTIEEAGVIYAPKPSVLPFTTSGTFIGDDDARFFVVQGAVTSMLAAEFADVANMISATTTSGISIDWADYLGRNVTTVVNNTTSNKGGKEYVITNVNPGGLSVLVSGIWQGKNHDLGGGFYALNNDQVINAYDLGCVDAGASFVNDSQPALFAARVLTDNIVIPKNENGLLIGSTNFTGIDQNYTGDGSIREPHFVTKANFGASSVALQPSGTVTMGNLNFKGSVDAPVSISSYYPSDAGTALKIDGTTNKQWSSFRDLFISGYFYGVHHDSAYYQEYQNLNCHDNNTGFWLDDTTSAAVGSSPIKGGHFRDNHLCGMRIDGNNDFGVYDTVFEFNRTHIIHNSGATRLEACYLGDGPWKVANVTGGRLILDQKIISSLGSGGNLSAGYAGTDGIDKKVDYHCGGVETSSTGICEIHNALVERNVYSNYGVSDGTRDNGSDFHCLDTSKIFFYNTKVKSYFPFSYASVAGSLRNGDTLNNYFINGLFDRPETLSHDIGGGTVVTMAAPVENPFAKYKLELTTSGNFSYACRFSVPERFIGTKMAMCLLIGGNTGSISNRTFGKSGFSVSSPTFAETSSTFWASGGIDAVSMAWYTVDITAGDGFAVLNGTSGASNTLNLYGFILTEVENYQKFGNYQDAWVRRKASSAPTSGTWSVMDTLTDEAPTAGATKFVCSVAGTPGTWVSG